jgi:predicted MPP superfamily phosphohydrolase
MERETGEMEPTPTTRRRVTRRRVVAGLAALGLGGGWGGAYTFTPRLTRRTLWMPRLPAGWDGVRVLHVTDLHHGPMVSGAYLGKALERARALPHDIAFFTGDFISFNISYMDGVRDLLRDWRAPLGAWATLGNHDHYNGPMAVTRALESIGVSVLSNNATRLKRNGDPLWLIGVDDPATSHARLPEAMRKVRDDAPRILLAHSPDIVLAFPERTIDLTLAGHTHGGQVCLPGGRPLICPTTLGADYAQGTFLWRKGALYVNRGLGVVNFPLRTFCPPEIALLTLRRGAGV